MKKLTAEDLAGFRDRLYLDIPDSALDKTLPPYYKPEPGLRRDASTCSSGAGSSAAPCRAGGRSSSRSRPRTTRRSTSSRRGSGKQEVATTMAFVRLLKELLKDPELGPRFVPIIPDEARTFGLDSLFSVAQDLQPGTASATPRSTAS